MTKAEAKQFVLQKLEENKVVIFSKSYCPFCKKAKEAFNGLWDYLAIELENMENCSNIQDVLDEMTGARSVPRVFIDKKFIGGGDETVDLKKSGELQKLVGK